MCMPAAHALLAFCSWKVWAFPYIDSKRQRGHSYNLSGILWQGSDQRGEAVDTCFEENQPFGTADFHALANTLIKSHQLLEGVNTVGVETCREKIKYYVSDV